MKAGKLFLVGTGSCCICGVFGDTQDFKVMWISWVPHRHRQALALFVEGEFLIVSRGSGHVSATCAACVCCTFGGCFVLTKEQC